MSDTTRTKLRSVTVKRSSTGIAVPRGKENARPSSVASRRDSSRSANANANANAKEAVYRTRIPVTRCGTGSFDRASGDIVVAKKTPFRIHCDEKNVNPSKRESRPIDSKVLANRTTDYAKYAFDDTFVAKKTPFKIHRDEDNVPGKSGYPKVDGDAGSKKASQVGAVRGIDTANYAIDDTAVVVKKTPIETHFDDEDVSGKRKSPPTVVDPGTEKAARDDRGTDKKPLPSRIPRRPRSCTMLPMKDTYKWLTPGRRGLRVAGVETFNTKIVGEANCLLAKENAKRIIPVSQGGSSKTPEAGWSRMVPVTRSTGQQTGRRRVNRGSVSTDSTEDESLVHHLLHGYEYYEDLPTVELQREKQSFRLSANFLQHSVSVEQRRLVVVFLIRVGAHGRYPPFAMYQAVKLFDAVLDKIPLNAWSMQLSALASLWIALKNQEHCRRIPSATKMVSLAKDLYQGREDLLIKYERRILLAFNFNVTFADPFSLYNYHVLNCRRCIDVPEETISFLRKSGNYLIDVTLLDEYFCWHGASLLALTVAELALGLAIDVHQPNSRPRWLFWRGMLFARLPSLNERHMAKDIDRSRVILLRRVLISGKKNYGFDVVYNKYTRSRYGRISEHLLKQAGKVSSAEYLFDL